VRCCRVWVQCSLIKPLPDPCHTLTVSDAVDDKYQPDPYQWVCTCLKFVVSCFLVCKHLVQSVHPVKPVFFLKVSHNRTTPFWSHRLLVPLTSDSVSSGLHPVPDTTPLLDHPFEHDGDGDEDSKLESENGLVDTGIGTESTFHERMNGLIHTTCDFCSGLEYQLQFGDRRMLATLERDGASFFHLAEACLSHERRLNSTRGVGPTMWEKTTTSAMYYQTRPPRGDLSHG
jgi:hypothetical protein